MNEIIKRLDVLETANKLSSTDKESIINFIEVSKINSNNEALPVFITHSVMALDRIKNNEQVEEVSDVILQELNKNENFNKAEDNVKLFEEVLDIKLPDYEVGYFLMHMINTLEKENND